MPRHERRLIEPRLPPPSDRHDQDATLYPHDRLHNFRVLRGWTQEIAADWWDVHPRTWRRWEAGDSTPPRALLTRIVAWGRRACPSQMHYLT